MSPSAIRKFPLAGLLAVLVAIAPAAAQQSRLRVEWNDYAPQYRGQTGRRVTVICPRAGTPTSVYGSGVYADNSSVCGAAAHAGAIDATNGGVVTMVIAPGMGAYQGSAQNGVTSRSLGAFAGSFTIARDSAPGQADWTTTAAGLSLAGKPLTLVCPATGDVRRVWGTDVYTEDSSICSAAVHAGVITAASGGAVTIESTGGQDRFAASDRNGVSSLEWKAFPTSFRVAPAPSIGRLSPTLRTGTTASSAAGVTIGPTGGLVTTESGGTATFTVRLNSPPSVDVVLPLTSSTPKEGLVSPASLTFTASNWMTPQTVTVRGVDDAVVDGDQSYVIRTGAIQAVGDAAYHNFNAADVAVTNTDDDVARVVVRPSAGLVTTERGGTATFTIALASSPTGPVSVSLASSNAREGSVSPASVTFDATNWSSPQMVTVTGVDDRAVDGDVGYSIVTGDAVSTDPRYNNLVVDDAGVVNRNDD